mgnify:FL=1
MNGERKILNNLGLLFIKKSKYKEAEEYFLKAVHETGEVKMKALNNLGILCHQQKRYKEAEEYYLKAIELGNVEAKDNLNRLYKAQKK